MKVHIVKWKTPLGPSLSPYANRVSIVRGVVYARLQAALDLVRQDRRARVLDFGCWDGHFLPSLLKHFDDVWAVDDDSASILEALPSRSTILQVARDLCEAELGAGGRVGLTKASGFDLPFRGGDFDVVFCLDTLTHVEEAARPRVIAELRRIVRPGGQVIVSLPVERGPARILRGFMRALTRKQIDVASQRYDFRKDLKLLQKAFEIRRMRFVPVHFLGALNPTLLLDCRRQPVSRPNRAEASAART